MRRLSGLAPLLLGCALVMGGCASLNLFKRSDGPATQTKGPRVGAPAPDLEGEDFSGQRFKLSDYRGKVVVVSFWASGCLPCRRLIPHEQAIVQRYRDKNFVLLGANLDDDRDSAVKAMNSCGVSWRNWRGGGEGNPIRQLWPVDFIPAIYLIDATGIVRYARVSGADLEYAIDTLLAETELKRN